MRVKSTSELFLTTLKHSMYNESIFKGKKYWLIHKLQNFPRYHRYYCSLELTISIGFLELEIVPTSNLV